MPEKLIVQIVEHDGTVADQGGRAMRLWHWLLLLVLLCVSILPELFGLWAR